MKARQMILAVLGLLLGSTVIAALINVLPWYFPPARQFEWVAAGIPATDCTANDTATSLTGSDPSPENCNARRVGTIAVCWTGAEYKNAANPGKKADQQWCAYKSVAPDKCSGGAAPGIVYVCREATRVDEKVH
jgi:hypothetical protein